MSETKSESHPSFGVISISHVQGTGVELFGSEFKHNHFIELCISRAERNRSLSREWYHDQEQIVTVALSESQFVEMISRPNQGVGTPCTLIYIDGERQPSFPSQTKIKDRFIFDMEKDLKDCSAGLSDARNDLEKAIFENKIGKSVLKEILSKLERAERTMKNGIPYVRDSFAEQMENIVDHASIEMEASVSSLAKRIGFEQIKQFGISTPKLLKD